MTVKEKIFELNKLFQISYYDTDFSFFNHSAPSMIQEIKSFISSVINEQHPLRQKVSRHFEILDIQIEDMITLSKDSSVNFWIKDKWLNGFKINVSNVCWGFNHDCWNYDENILNYSI